jgi:hypothetical protein
MANNKHISAPQAKYNQMTGQESGSNPMAASYKGKYENHQQSHQTEHKLLTALPSSAKAK